MPEVAVGSFFIMLVMGFGFMFVGITRSFNWTKLFSILSLAIFVGLALLVAPGPDIVAEKTITDGTTTWTERQIILSSDVFWLSYVFMGLAILNVVLFINNIWRVENN